MKPIRHLALIAVLLGATSWALAEEAKKDSAAASVKTVATVDKTAAKGSKGEMICTSERVTGSRFARRICHSREEREMMAKAGRETVEKIQQMPLPLRSD